MPKLKKIISQTTTLIILPIALITLGVNFGANVWLATALVLGLPILTIFVIVAIVMFWPRSKH